ncbi:SAM-dependent DNA methyltransferase [Desulfofundulus thermobenzoicus]|uniref:site-specific DNA-methyltransferase (adenine-specific) n=1 Tax=Desulfofundulus thermobenzoicus TaxID=29376 RepID=A0A6N7IWA7_9FIRM|nr:DNA methyltransferase [Desulfofundulus thermobenzoicus]MQL53839.1 SAM-dependent DNA methyltransferase [Desulfofundulus thermobenzoicus]
MPVLSVEQRNKLERTVVEARDVAEAGARAALEALAVHHHEPYSHMSPEQRRLRNHLRARARQLGDKQDKSGKLEITHLIQECAYEHWHRMLFASFLAENDLLIEPEMGVAVSLEECEELAKEEGTDLWTLASRFAQQMLPQIFRPDDPVLQVTFPYEYQLKLEQLLDDLEPDIFKASDALGWVYQFWQSKRKKQVNESGSKIGADELPAVTQLFTEPYMVNFLIHNTIGAWYAGRVLAENPQVAGQAESEEELRKAVALPGITWDYLRFVRTGDGEGPWRPAAGTFEGWPKRAAGLKILDPCCGSGHFLVAALYHLVPIRMAEEGLAAREACDAVLRDNLHGLEIDERCTQIAAFALALAAWTYPGAGGYRPLPGLRIACSGIAPNTKKENWSALTGDDERLRKGMVRLYDLFRDAPILGSLIDPSSALEDSLYEARFDELRPLLEKAMSAEKDDYEQHELGVAACGIADAVQILGGRYHLIITNVPYLVRGKQTNSLKEFCAEYYDEAKNDIATVFLDRLFRLNSPAATTALVMPQNWLFLTTYKKFRTRMLKTRRWDIVAKLGPGAFEAISGEVVNVALLAISASTPLKGHTFAGIDATTPCTAQEKAKLLRSAELKMMVQAEQLKNPDSRVAWGVELETELLEKYADSYWGLGSGDYPRFGRVFWELSKIGDEWVFQLSTVEQTKLYGGREHILLWENGEGALVNHPGSFVRGIHVWGKEGVHVSQMRQLPVTLYTGEAWDTNSAPIIPKNPAHLPAIWCFCSSPEYNEAVRKIDQKLNVTNATLVKVPFDLEYWQKVAAEKYPNGLPEPYSDDPTQWIFHGHPAVSTSPLQVAVARLLGYRWPAELDDSMRLSAEARELVQRCRELEDYADSDGIVCIPSVRGEDPAAERLRALLAAAYGDDWSPTKEQELIAATGSEAKELDEWLRNDFFEQHCRLFHHRPFIWHIWDGRRRDGFHALVNYHKLAGGSGKGRQVLESLTYSYLGEWITRQKDGVKRGEGGAEDRLAAALELQKRLIAILEGEPPFDIFVRWKPIEKQPIGWEPDINDGVRINIRPFMASDIPGGRKGAGILRWKPNINWGKDRGKEPTRPQEQFPWFWKNGKFTGDRVNDVHLTNEEKRKARETVNRSR